MVKKGRVRIIVIAAVVASSVLFGGAYSVYAANTGTAQAYPTIVEKLAKAFNLDPAKVNDVFMEHRKELEAQRTARLEEKLDKAVESGRITEAQKAAILKKTDEMRTKLEEIKDLAPEERKEALQEFYSEMATWAKDNKIDLRYLKFGHRGHKFGPKGLKPGEGGPMPGSRFGPDKGGPMTGPGEATENAQGI